MLFGHAGSTIFGSAAPIMEQSSGYAPAPPPLLLEAQSPSALLIIGICAGSFLVLCACWLVCTRKQRPSAGWGAPRNRLVSNRMQKSDDGPPATELLPAATGCLVCGGFGCWKCQPCKPQSAFINVAAAQQCTDARSALALHRAEMQSKRDLALNSLGKNRHRVPVVPTSSSRHPRG